MRSSRSRRRSSIRSMRRRRWRVSASRVCWCCVSLTVLNRMNPHIFTLNPPPPPSPHNTTHKTVASTSSPLTLHHQQASSSTTTTSSSSPPRRNSNAPAPPAFSPSIRQITLTQPTHGSAAILARAGSAASTTMGFSPHGTHRAGMGNMMMGAAGNGRAAASAPLSLYLVSPRSPAPKQAKGESLCYIYIYIYYGYIYIEAID